MIECDKHGLQPMEHVSPDLQRIILNGLQIPRFDEIEYWFEGDLVYRMLVSKHFVEEEGVSQRGRNELPEKYPTWVSKMMPVCTKCMEAVGINVFDSPEPGASV